ncbi:hypothetical protein Q3G72_003346 [Acer saccharum]|nr:hypothetical protein Q3G72_003346 [Acer saccharum]
MREFGWSVLWVFALVAVLVGVCYSLASCLFNNISYLALALHKSQVTSRVQMTEDEVVLHFFQFDGSEKGGLSMINIQRVATAHDFTWTDDELADMIRCFDSDRDGKFQIQSRSRNNSNYIAHFTGMECFDVLKISC